jgi:hypothetical protein
MRIALTFKTIIVSLLCLFLNSCTKEDSQPNNTTTVEQDKTFLNGVVSNTNNCIQAAKDGSLSQTIINFLDLKNGTAGNEDWAYDLDDRLQEVMGSLNFDYDTYELNLPQYFGTYTWNSNSQTFVKTPSANAVIIIFPSSPAATSNNVTISLLEYVESLYHINAKDVYLPLRARGNIVKDDVKIADVDFTANYSTGDFPIPLNVSFASFMAPNTYSFTLQEVNSTKFNFSSQLLTGEGCGISLNSTVTFKNDDYNNLSIEEDLANITADYTSGDLNIKSNFDANTYFALNDPTTDNLNSSLVTTVYNKTEKIGELKFKDADGEQKLFIFYKDGSSENSTAYYDPFTTNLKNTLRPMFGEDVDLWF